MERSPSVTCRMGPRRRDCLPRKGIRFFPRWRRSDRLLVQHLGSIGTSSLAASNWDTNSFPSLRKLSANTKMISTIDSPMVTQRTPGWTSKSPAVYPHRVLIFLVQISEQTAIIFPYINCLFFVTEMGYVYCEVRKEFLNIIQFNHSLHVAGLSQRRPGFDCRSFLVRFMVTKWLWNRFFSDYFGFPLSI